MDDGIFFVDQNGVSGRYAVFDDNETTGWLYLTEPNEQRPWFDCWIYNRIPPPNPKDITKYRDEDGPPPASTEFMKEDTLVTAPERKVFSFKWSRDGHAVALMIDDIPMGFIVAGKKIGWSRNVKKSGPWGDLFDELLFRELFEM